MNLIEITLFSCAAMMFGDIFATTLTIAESKGKDTLAGICDVGNDLFSKFILVAYGGTALTHHGIWGWVGVIPVLFTGFLTTKYTTRWARKLKPEMEITPN